MRLAAATLAMIVAVGAGPLFAGANNPAKLKMIKDIPRAEFNWVMNCQGCHGIGALGTENGAPNMKDEVARFLSVEGGREYLVRVPGVAHAPVSDGQLADLVNWMILEFDCGHVPEDFQAYTADEVGALRKDVLISEAPVMRSALMADLQATSSESGEQSEPTGSFCSQS